MTRYRLRPKAVEDLESIGDFIAASNPARAISFVNDLPEVCARIAQRPAAHQRRDDLAPGLRQVVYGRHLIFFSDGDDGIIIERVLYGARRLEDLL